MNNMNNSLVLLLLLNRFLFLIKFNKTLSAIEIIY